jgi:hypothetical protein
LWSSVEISRQEIRVKAEGGKSQKIKRRVRGGSKNEGGVAKEGPMAKIGRRCGLSIHMST